MFACNVKHLHSRANVANVSFLSALDVHAHFLLSIGELWIEGEPFVFFLFLEKHLRVQLINQTIVKNMWLCFRTFIEAHYCQYEPLPDTKASSGTVAITKSCQVQQQVWRFNWHHGFPPICLKQHVDTRSEDTTTRTRRHDDTSIRRHWDTTARRHHDTRTRRQTAWRHDGTTSGQHVATTDDNTLTCRHYDTLTWRHENTTTRRLDETVEFVTHFVTCTF
jgi:hypothetical protein